MAKETITVFDSQGQPREIPRAEFMEQALPKLLAAAWNDANMLSQQITFALGEGMHAGVADAARRLDELDGGSERSKVLLAAVEFQNGGQEAAENALRETLAKHGESAVAVINLARVRAGRGDQNEAEQLLERALQLDPNQENALGWRCQLLQERSGDPAVLEFLQDWRETPGHWRARLWLASHWMRTGQLDDGLEEMRLCIADSSRDPAAFLSASAELGKAGCLEELAAWVGPYFDERRHRPETGFNLMQALLQLQRRDEALAVFKRMAALNLAPLVPALTQFAKALGVDAPTPPQVAPGVPAQAQPSQAGQAPGAAQQQLEIRLFVIQGPVWGQGIGAQWLIPEKAADAPIVAFAGFADATLNVTKDAPAPQIDEVRNRLSRALPMYLCEALWLRTQARTDVIVPILPGGAFVVTGQLWPAETLLKGRPENQKPKFLIQGLLTKDDGGLGVELIAYDGKTSTEVHRIAVSGLKSLSGVSVRLEKELIDWLATQGVARAAQTSVLGRALGGSTGGADDITVAPPPESHDQHLLSLASLLSQAIPAIGLGSRENLADERALVEACMALARTQPRSSIARAIAACSILLSIRYGSTSVDKQKEEMAAWIEADRADDGVLRLLSPALLLRLGKKDKSDAAKAALLATPGASESYRRWLGDVKA
jgi:tetratricopeptide (TPR) repeat protein